MSYAQFLIDLNRSQSFPNRRCVQPFVTQYNIGCRFNEEWDELIPGEVLPDEHREDEERAVDDTWDLQIDHCLPSVVDEPLVDDWGMRIKAGPVRRINAEDLYKLSGRVIGRHDAVVDLAWYLKQDYIVKCLQCTYEQAADLIDAFRGIDADESIVQMVLQEVKEDGIHYVTLHYQILAFVMRKLEVSAEDAMEHRNEEGFDHNRLDKISYSITPEWDLLIDEEVKLSAAKIAHEVDCSLADAGDIRQALKLHMYEYALDLANQRGSVHSFTSSDNEVDEDEPDHEADNHDEDDSDFSGFVSEGWHLMDDKDDYGPSWLDLQPIAVQKLFGRINRSKNLKELKVLGQEAFAMKDLTPVQRKGFWAAWKVKRLALLSFNMNKIARVRKGVQRILSADVKEFPHVSMRLHALSKAQKDFYSPEGWAVMWAAQKMRKASIKANPSINR